METLFAVVCLIVWSVSFIAVIKPLPKLGLPTRKRALLVMLLSPIVLGVPIALISPTNKSSQDQDELRGSTIDPELQDIPLVNPPASTLTEQKKETIKEPDEPVKSDRTKYSDAEKLTVISSPNWGEYETTKRRFSFLLKEFEENCKPQPGKAAPVDMLVTVHGLLAEAGLDGEEGLLDFANNLHRMTSDIAISSNSASVGNPDCAQTWVMYLQLRKKGRSPLEARKGVTAIARTLYGLTKAKPKSEKRATPVRHKTIHSSASVTPDKLRKKSQPKTKGELFQELAGQARRLIKKSNENILDVGVGGDGSGGWILIIEVSRGTMTHYAKTVGEDSLYILQKKFAEMGPADYEVTVTRAGTPWKAHRYVSPIWRGIMKKGARKVQWEQVIGDEPVFRKSRK